jgi:hypothetical protein
MGRATVGGRGEAGRETYPHRHVSRPASSDSGSPRRLHAANPTALCEVLTKGGLDRRGRGANEWVCGVRGGSGEEGRGQLTRDPPRVLAVAPAAFEDEELV